MKYQLEFNSKNNNKSAGGWINITLVVHEDVGFALGQSKYHLPILRHYIKKWKKVGDFRICGPK